MKFFKPQVQLARQHQMDAADTYLLHIVTFCPRTCYRADGHSVDTDELANGLYKVTINLLQDTTLPDMEYITPVVHTLDLGAISFPNGDGWIQVNVLGAVVENTTRNTRDTTPTTTKTGGSGTVSTTDADDKARPISADSLI
ncbi:MAG: hypothetical protein ABIQ93_02845 [Saprospiraceae bacterium]